MPERDTAETRLQRLLHVLAAASRDGGATLDELAAALDCDPDQVLRDIEEATAREYYHRAGSVDAFQILVEEDRVRVWTTGEFRRPTRLTPHETLAVGLALRVLAAESAADRRLELLGLADRLEARLAAPPIWEVAESAAPSMADRAMPQASVREAGAFYEAAAPPPLRPGAGDVDEIIVDAAERGVRLRILYLKPGDAAPVERDVAPWRLVYAAGRWYVLGHDAARDDVRVFRFDRVLAAEATSRRFVVPDDFEPSDYIGREGAPFLAATETAARVRYSPAIARWVAEASGVEPEADGAVVLVHPVADEEWLVRHVLRYGGEAEVLEPAGMRARVAAAARSLA